MYDRQEYLQIISTLYYKEGKTQQEISDLLQITRPTVSRLLKEALQRGIVTITINNIEENYLDLCKKIRNTWNLNSVVICSSTPNELSTKSNLANKLLPNLKQILDTCETVGIGWGTTLYELLNFFPSFHTNIKEIIPLIGGYGITNMQYHSNSLVIRAADKFISKYTLSYTPPYDKDEETVRELYQFPLVAKQIEKAKSVDIALITPDAITEHSTLKRLGYADKEELDTFRAQGIIGNILCSFYDIAGHTRKTTFTDKMIGLKLDDLRNIRRVYLCAARKEKSLSVLGALNSGIITDLAIDVALAEELIIDMGASK